MQARAEVTAGELTGAREYNRAHLLMLLLMLVYGLTQILWAEKLPVNNGLGWDGAVFARSARDFPGQVLGGETNKYYMQRILPSGIVYYTLSALQIPHTDRAIIRAFEILNLLGLLVAVALWRSISNSLELLLRSRWLGFIGIFATYGVMKWAFYYPVLTDVPALAGAMAMFAGFLRRNQFTVFVSSLLMAFAWPVAPYCGAALLLWPRQQLREIVTGERDYSRFLAAGLAAFGMALSTYLYFYLGREWDPAGVGGRHYYLKEFVVPSILLVALFVYAAFKTLLSRVGIASVVQSIKAIRPLDAVLAVALLVIVKGVISLLAKPLPGEMGGAKSFLAFTSLMPITKPGVFIVAAIVYFGPIVILMGAHFPAIARYVRQLGPGFLCVVGLNVYLLLTSESRHSQLIYPALVALFIKLTESWHWRRSAYYAIAIVSLVFARWWWQIDMDPLAWVPGAEWSFPIQRYFMTLGPWMSPFSLAVQAAAIALVILLFHWLRLGPDAVPSAPPVPTEPDR